MHCVVIAEVVGSVEFLKGRIAILRFQPGERQSRQTQITIVRRTNAGG